MLPYQVNRMSGQITRMALKASAVQIALLEDELNSNLEAEIQRIEAEGKTELAARLRAIAQSDMAALEAPAKRGRPAKKLEGE